MAVELDVYDLELQEREREGGRRETGWDREEGEREREWERGTESMGVR